MKNWLWKQLVAPASNLNIHTQINRHLDFIAAHLTQQKANADINKINTLRNHLHAKDFDNLEIEFLQDHKLHELYDYLQQLYDYLQLVKNLKNKSLENDDIAALLKKYEYAQLKDWLYNSGNNSLNESDIKNHIYTQAEAAYQLIQVNEKNEDPLPTFANEENTLTILIDGNCSNAFFPKDEEPAKELCGRWYQQGHTIRGKDICQVSYIGTKNHNEMVNRVVDTVCDMQKQSGNKYKNIQLCGTSLGGNIAIHAAKQIKKANNDLQVSVSTSSSPISGTRYVWETLKSLRFRGKCIAALAALVSAPFYLAANILTLGYVHRSIKNALPKAPDPEKLEKQGITINTTRKENDEVVPIKAQIKAATGKNDQLYVGPNHNDPVHDIGDHNLQKVDVDEESSIVYRHDNHTNTNQNSDLNRRSNSLKVPLPFLENEQQQEQSIVINHVAYN
ncbi:hypothetical protein [Facilibium subflavum]|uniref:hypothetical protein n=1 Tax=Facilibium subflavum TaxID=2219058 RepID=UPI000E653DAC|nr:hypothetical protein [Facilibium subflavum]